MKKIVPRFFHTLGGFEVFMVRSEVSFPTIELRLTGVLPLLLTDLNPSDPKLVDELFLCLSFNRCLNLHIGFQP